LAILVVLALLAGVPRQAHAANSNTRWIVSGILYGLSAIGFAVAAYGVYQIETAPNARTLGLYHATANAGQWESGAGAAVGVLGLIGGSMTILISNSTSRRRVALVPTGNGLAVRGWF
jgi:hypothetical protein